ncbi:MAG: amino acid adenylation domain-containing protein [Bacillota bacterium]
MRGYYTVSRDLREYNSIMEILKERAVTQPDDIAFCFLSFSGDERKEHVLTYKELDTEARKIGAYLQKLNLSGKCAILLYPDGLEFITAFYGCLYANVIAVPLYHFITKRKAGRVLSIIEDSEAKIFLSDNHHISNIKTFVAKNLPGKSYHWFTIDNILNVNPDDFNEENNVSNELAYLQYTSGSTAIPKGVMMTHRNVMHNMDILKWHFNHTPDSISVSWIPHFHDLGLISTILHPVYMGFKQVLMLPTDFITKPYRFLKAISDFRGTTTCMPNFAFEHCANLITSEERKTLDLSSLDSALNGAEPVYWSTIEQFNETFKECGLREDVVFPVYGLAEATLFVASRNPDPKSRPMYAIDIDKDEYEKNNTIKLAEAGDNSMRFCSHCHPREDTHVVIADPSTLRKCPEGKVGEIWVSSESVSPGYWKKKEVNEEVFNARLSDTGEGPFLRTGDLGFFYEGNLYISGRLKDVIIIRGVNYYPNDIEFTAAHCHPALVPNSCAAFSITVKSQERLFIAQEVKRSESSNMDPDEIFDAIRKAVSEVHGLQVHGILLLRYGRIYKTSSGKIQRKRCKESYLNGELEALHVSIIDADEMESANKELSNDELLKDGVEAACERVEKELANRIAALLKIDKEKIKKTKSLVSLGMDSITVTVLKQSIQDRYLCQVEIADLFDSSVTELAKIIVDKMLNEKPLEVKHDASLPAFVSNKEEMYSDFPLTELQTAYWMGRNEGFELGGVAAHAYMEVNVTGTDIDHNRLSEAWQKLIERHPMLRTVITKDGQQRILEDIPTYKIVCHDLQNCSPTEQIQKCEDIRSHLSHQVIQVDSWPWFEIQHTKLSQDKSILHISIDLLIADVWSINLLFKEWFLLYTNFQAPLPELEINFRDYCLTLEKMKEWDDYKKSESYWKQRINTLPPAPSLPLAKAPKDIKQVRFNHRADALPLDLWANIKERASNYGVTPSVVLMAAFSKILGLWSRSSKFSLNLTLFNRPALHPYINHLVGDFTSVLVMEVDNGKALRFADFAKSLQRQLAQDMEHRHYSGVNVIRDLAKQWDKSPQEAILPVVFTSALSADGPMVFQSRKEFFGETNIISQTPQVSLDHQVYENEDHLVLSWDSVDELFPKNMLDDMFQVYTDFLRELASNPSTWEREIHDLLPQYQKEKRKQYNATKGPLPEELLYSQFVKNALSKPEAISVITSNRTVTYKELINGASYLAGYLRDQGVQPNQLVAVMMNKGWEQIAAVLGITMAGGAYVCIDPGLPQERKNYLLEHSQAKLILAQKNQEGLPDGVGCFIVDEAVLAQSSCFTESQVKPDDLAYVLYTSGSTGFPKGVTISHRGALNTIMDINQRFEVTPQDRAFAISSLSFDLSVYDIFGMLHAGGAIVVPDPFTERNPDHWQSMIQRHNVTVWNSVPALMEMLIENAEVRDKKVPLRLVMLSGDWIPVTLPERIWKIHQDARVISLGGATEASIWSIYYPVDCVDSSWTSIPYGMPLKNQTFYVLNQFMGECPEWVPGELYIGGDGVALNYWRDKEKTEKSFLYHPVTGDRIYKTGDLGRFHPDGYIEFLGREDFQVKLGGFRIELGEIESVLNSHPKVRRAVVKKIINKDGNAMLASYLVLNSLAKLEQVKSKDAGTKDLSSEIISDGESEVILDPHQRLLFKLKNPGLRFESGYEPAEKTLGTPIPLQTEDFDLESYSRRISCRRFLDTPLSLKNLSRFLECLRKAELDGLKRFRYGSAGGLYPVQAYIYIKQNKVEGFKGGFYYYHPFDHSLIPIKDSEGMSEKVHVSANQAIYSSSAFTVFLVGKLSAIRPLYGSRARDFCLIEAGLITQLLENSGVENELGLCQIGALADEACVRDLLDLDEDHIILHVLLGGKVDYKDPQRGMLPETEGETNSSDRSSIVQELRDYCSKKLPHYMVPTCCMILDDIPLTSVGKVNYKVLPDPEVEAALEKDCKFNPSNEMEELIHNIFKEKSGISTNLDVDKSLFELGINSLTITRAWRDIVKETGIDFPVIRIFEKPTISALASYLNGLNKQGEDTNLQEEAIRDKAARQREALLKRNMHNRRILNR